MNSIAKQLSVASSLSNSRKLSSFDLRKYYQSNSDASLQKDQFDRQLCRVTQKRARLLQPREKEISRGIFRDFSRKLFLEEKTRVSNLQRRSFRSKDRLLESIQNLQTIR